MKGLTLTTKDLQASSNPLWRQAAGGTDRKPRKKRFTGPTSESKAWVREMSRGPGRFFQNSRIINWANWRGHWAEKSKITNQQTKIGLVEATALMRGEMYTPPYEVTMTRYGSKRLDDDGLACSLKFFQDGIAIALGVNDGDPSQVIWIRRQEVAPHYGLRIEIRMRNELEAA